MHTQHSNISPSPEDALRLVVEGTSGVTGRDFFRALVRDLAQALGTRYAMVAEVLPDAPGSVRTLATWTGQGHGSDFDYTLAGTPCEHVAGHAYCEFPSGVRERFPLDAALVEMGVDAYMGMPMFGSSGAAIGLLALMDDRPRPHVPHVEPILRVFAARAAAELERQRGEAALRRTVDALRVSEGRYQLIAHASPVGVFHTDPAGNCTYANPRCCQIVGTRVEALTGQGWVDRIHPDDQQLVLAERARARAAGDAFAAEYRFLHADGRAVWVFGQSRPARGAGGEVLAWIGTLTDITPFKEAQAALHASEQRYAALAENSSVGIWQVRPGGETLYLNPAMRAMLELSPAEDLSGRTFHEFFAPSSLRTMSVEHAKRSEGRGSAYEVELIGARGGRRAVLLSGAPLLGVDGQVESLIGTFLDVTERQRIEQALRDAYSSLRDTHESLQASEDRLRMLVGQTPAIMWTVDRSMTFTSSEGAGLVPLGIKPQQVVGQTVPGFFGTDDPAFPPVGGHLRALAGQTATYEQEWEGRTFHTTIEPLRGPDRAVVGAVGISIDITARRRAEEALREANDRLENRVRERTAELERAVASLRESEEHHREAAASNRRLLTELDHRVRNNVAGLISLVSLMRARTRDVDAFADAIDSRLHAMAHVHRMLADTHFQPVDLRSLAGSLLSAGTRMSTCPGACTVDGPPMTVPPRQTLPLSMILLEWFTNSCKYGACSVAGGKVDLSWELVRAAPRAGPDTVRLRWRETGGPPVSQDVRPSLGTELVESFATLEMRGRCRLSYPEGGADHVLEFPRD